MFEELWKMDPEVAQAIIDEVERERTHLELIASENFTSTAVMEATASALTNKYAEGYPDKRYYGGCQFVDVVEELARNRAKLLFQADYANVQPHSGSQANQAAYLHFLEAGDAVLAMSLSHGGHLTHGAKVNFSGRMYKFEHYGVDRETELIDYDRVLELAKKHRPKMIVAGASSYPRVIDFDRFRAIADEVGACLMVDMAHITGLVAACVHPSPVPMSDVVTATTHKTLRGPRGGFILVKERYGPGIDKAVFPGVQGGPLMHVIAAKAVAFKEALGPAYVEYQKQALANVRRLAATMERRGFRLVSGGTDTNLFLVDLTSKGMTGMEAQLALDEVGITVNRNAIPFDTRSPQVTSGIRIGCAAVTTRGMKEGEMETIGGMIADILDGIKDEPTATRVKKSVAELIEAFPLYPGLEQHPCHDG